MGRQQQERNRLAAKRRRNRHEELVSPRSGGPEENDYMDLTAYNAVRELKGYTPNNRRK